MIDPRKLGQYLMGEWNATNQPIQERGNVLPLGTYDDGSVHFAWPEMSGLPAFNRMAERGPVWDASSPEGQQHALDALSVGGSLALGGIGASGVSQAPRNALMSNGVRAYHGTSGELQGGRFLRGKAGANFDNEVSHAGVSFDSSPEVASRYAKDAANMSEWRAALEGGEFERYRPGPGDGSAVVPVDIYGRGGDIEESFLSLGPAEMAKRIEALKQAGYDYARFPSEKSTDIFGENADGTAFEYNVWTPNTVRSATTGETLFSNPKEAAAVQAGVSLANDTPRNALMSNGVRGAFERQPLSPGATRVDDINGMDLVRLYDPKKQKLTYHVIDDSGDDVGFADVHVDDNHMNWVNINDDIRGKGVGTKLYNAVENDRGRTVHPSPELITNEAFNFWVKRDPRELLKSTAGSLDGYSSTKPRIVSALRKSGLSDAEIERRLGVSVNTPFDDMRSEMRGLYAEIGSQSDKLFSNPKEAAAVQAGVTLANDAPRNALMSNGVRIEGQHPNYTILKGDTPAGRAYVREYDDTIQLGHLNIDPAYQRKGVGTEAQRLLAEQYGKPTVPDQMLSPSEYARWAKNDPAAVADYEPFMGGYGPRQGTAAFKAAYGGAPVPGTRAASGELFSNPPTASLPSLATGQGEDENLLNALLARYGMN